MDFGIRVKVGFVTRVGFLNEGRGRGWVSELKVEVRFRDRGRVLGLVSIQGSGSFGMGSDFVVRSDFETGVGVGVRSSLVSKSGSSFKTKNGFQERGQGWGSEFRHWGFWIWV